MNITSGPSRTNALIQVRLNSCFFSSSSWSQDNIPCPESRQQPSKPPNLLWCSCNGLLLLTGDTTWGRKRGHPLLILLRFNSSLIFVFRTLGPGKKSSSRIAPVTVKPSNLLRRSRSGLLLLTGDTTGGRNRGRSADQSGRTTTATTVSCSDDYSDFFFCFHVPAFLSFCLPNIHIDIRPRSHDCGIIFILRLNQQSRTSSATKPR